MNLIMMTTTTAQSVLADGIIPLTSIARRKGCSIQSSNNSVILGKPSYYKVSATITFTAPAAGNTTVALFKNGVTVPGITATQTITTATTEVRSMTLDGIVRVFCNEGQPVLTLVNTGVGITISNVELSVFEL